MFTLSVYFTILKLTDEFGTIENSIGAFSMKHIGFPILSNIYPIELTNSTHELLFLLLAGLLVYAVFIHFDYVLLQSGILGRQNLLCTVNIITNIVPNVIFIPIFGIWGAALVTAISFSLSAVSLKFAASLWLGCRKGLMFNP